MLEHFLFLLFLLIDHCVYFTFTDSLWLNLISGVKIKRLRNSDSLFLLLLLFIIVFSKPGIPEVFIATVSAAASLTITAEITTHITSAPSASSAVFRPITVTSRATA